MDGEGLRQILIANCCVAVFLAVPEDYQLYATAAITATAIAFTTLTTRRNDAKQSQD